MSLAASLSHYARRIEERLHERWLGINTTHIDRRENRGFSPTSYRDWRIIRAHIRPDRASTFIDYGTGLGRATILAARMPFREVIGVEIDPAAAARANANIRSAASRLICPAFVFAVDAAAYRPPPDASVFYFANSFCGSILLTSLEHIRKSVSPRRPVSIVCNLPRVSAFEHDIGTVAWLRLASNTPLPTGRKCLIFERRDSDSP